MICPCDTGLMYEECCAKYHNGAHVPNAISLMRSRYSAFSLSLADYLVDTLYPASRSDDELAQIQLSFAGTHWESLVITDHKDGDQEDAEVSFQVTYSVNAERLSFAETSRFKRDLNKWFYVDGKLSTSTPTPALKRNDVCWCLSEKKFKKCHGR